MQSDQGLHCLLRESQDTTECMSKSAEQTVIELRFLQCTSSDDHLSMYRISFNSLLYFQRYAPDKPFISKIKKGSNSVNTGDRVMVLAFCIPLIALFQCTKFLLFVFKTFRDMLQTSLLLRKLEREITL